LRFSLTLFPQASVDFAPLLLVLATIGIIYGAIVATVQKDMKKLVAYSSVAHLGFVVLGTFALTTQGIQGGLFTMISHGLTTGAHLTMKDLNAREVLTLVPLLGLSVFLGVYPKPVLDRLEPSVKALIVHVEQHSDWCESDHKAADGTCEPGDRFTSEATGTG